MHRVYERETIFLVSSAESSIFRWKKVDDLLPGQETIWAKAYFKGVPSSMNAKNASGFGLIEVNSDTRAASTASSARKTHELLVANLRKHITWVNKLVVTFSGFAFTTSPFPKALIKALEQEAAQTPY